MIRLGLLLALLAPAAQAADLGPVDYGPREPIPAAYASTPCAGDPRDTAEPGTEPRRPCVAGEVLDRPGRSVADLVLPPWTIRPGPLVPGRGGPWFDDDDRPGRPTWAGRDDDNRDDGPALAPSPSPVPVPASLGMLFAAILTLSLWRPRK